MAAIRRPPPEPRPTPKPKKVKAPLHQRILGRGATELDTVEDLEHELEEALSLDLIEWEDYLDCREALDVRKFKAKEQIDKAIGRHIKQDKKVGFNGPMIKSPTKKLSNWQVKLICVAVFLLFWKFNIKA